MQPSEWSDGALRSAVAVTRDLLASLEPAQAAPHRRALRLYGAELSRRGYSISPGPASSSGPGGRHAT